MKLKLIQPRYPQKGGERASFDEIVKMLDSITEADLIVLPEGSNAPAVAPADALAFTRETEPILLEAAVRAAKRCHAYVCVNGCFLSETGIRNRTLFYSPAGEAVALYDKSHLTPSEAASYDYSYLPNGGLRGISDVDGMRLGFVTCYDSYFDEYLETVAARHPDIIFLCSFQRWETPHVLQMQVAHLAHKADCFVLRSSWYMGTGLGGNTCVGSPDGKIIALLDESEGILSCEIDPKQKRTEPKNQGMKYRADRHPQFYLPAGAAIKLPESEMPYPRLCAHRGVNTIAPENTLPALGLAIAAGADEIEFDVRRCADGVPVICHDTTVDRMTGVHNWVRVMTLDEIKACDAGVNFGPHFAGTRLPTLEEVLMRFSGQAVMNMHIYWRDTDDDDYYRRLFDLIYRYGAENHVYIAGDEDVLKQAVRFAPELPRACLHDQDHPENMLATALKYGCTKLQFGSHAFDEDVVRRAKEAGLHTNLFYCDDPEKVPYYLEKGIDTILTNDYIALSGGLKK